jgi:hypothetical protein
LIGFFGTFATGGKFAFAPLYAGCGVYFGSSGPQPIVAALAANKKANPQERGDISDILQASSKLRGTVVCVLPILQGRDVVQTLEICLSTRPGGAAFDRGRAAGRRARRGALALAEAR